MIFGTCPYCHEHIVFAIDEDIPMPYFTKIECTECKKTFWEKVSRIVPEAFTLEEVEVDEEARKILSIRGVAV